MNPVYLKGSDLLLQLSEQKKRAERKYEKITIACAIVVSVAVAITTLALSIWSMVTIPLVLTEVLRKGKVVKIMAAAPGYELREILSIIGFTVGYLACGAAAGFLTYGIGKAISKYKIHQFQKFVDKTGSILQPEERVSGKQLAEILPKADAETGKNLIAKMDFPQLFAAKKILGEHKFRQLLFKNDQANQTQHTQWRELLSIDFTASHNSIAKIQQLDIQALEEQNPLIRAAAFDQLQKMRNITSRLVVASAWMRRVSQNPEDEQIKLRIVDTRNSKNEETLLLSRSLIENNSRFFQVLSRCPDEEAFEEIRVDDVASVKQLIALLGGNPAHPLNSKETQRLFRSAFKYTDIFADSVQWVWSDKELQNLSHQSPQFKKYFTTRQLALA